MSADLILYAKNTITDSGQMPWQQEERDNWYVAHITKPTGTTLVRAKRTAHAAAIGRALLTHYQEDGATEVRVYRYDTDGDARRHLAIVTDPRPVNPEVEKLERALEAARPAQWEYERLRSAVEGAMTSAYLASNDLDKTDPSHRSANALAEMVKGLISRPPVLKRLAVHEEQADL